MDLNIFKKKPETIVPDLTCKTEIVLSDGKFATIHHVRVGHFLKCKNENTDMTAISLLKELVKIDGEFLTTKDIMNLKLEDFTTITKHLL